MRGATVLVLALLAPPAPRPVTVPFAWTPGQIEVAVSVNGTPATFLLDTGSEYSVVSTRLANALGLALTPRLGRDFADGVTLQAGSIDLPRQHVMVMPFDGYYARGRTIDGLLGYDLFDRYAVRIDVRAKQLTFWERDAFVAPKPAIDVPIAFAGRLPVVSGVLRLGDGRALDARLMVDTGASQAVLLRHPFAARHSLFALASGERPIPSLADGTRRVTGIPVDSLAIGGLTFDRPQVSAFTEPIGSAGGTDTDGLIGNALLTRYTIYVDYARKRLLLEPVPR